MAHSPPSDHERTNDRLVRPLRISKQMRPFVERMRLGRKNLDLSDPATALQFERKQDEMRRILAATKVSSAKMKRAIERTTRCCRQPSAASRAAGRQETGSLALQRRRGQAYEETDGASRSDRQAATERQEKTQRDCGQSHRTVFRYRDICGDNHRHCCCFAKACAQKAAQDAVDVIDQPIPEVVRTAPPEIIELWETMSAGTRQKIELKIRRLVPKKSAIEFLRQLVVFLKRFSTRSKAGRRTIQRQYIERVGEVWQGLGLRIGRAYDGINDKSIESRFQRYCRLALAAVGDNSQISGRQIVAVNDDLRKRPDGRVKRIK